MVSLMHMVIMLVLSEPMVHGARILGMLPFWAKSHHRFMQPVMKTLAKAGHEVVVYSPFPLEDPPQNYTDVFLESIKTDSKELQDFFLEIADYPEWKCIDVHLYLYQKMYKDFIEEPNIVELLSKKEKFDLMVVEGNTMQEHVLVLGHIFKIPIISLQAFMVNNFINSNAGNDLALPYIPDTCISLSNKMTFYERLYNAFAILRGLYFYFNMELPTLEKSMKKHFPEMPPITELTKSVALYFVNDHGTADYARPRPPNIIPVAGLHIDPPKLLPKDIQIFMDNAAEGVIFFSLGTYVADELQPKEYFDMYINVFKRFKQRVLWKTRKENILGIPENVMILKWAPQLDILAHPKCVLFITHGGLLSQHEAIHFGVPVVGIPQFYDQHRNVRYYEEQGVGVKVAADDLSEKTLTAAIHKVLGHPSYRENMKRLSAIFKDWPMSPAESVVFWTEYVLRHGGAPHLRPASTELRWYQLILLDVFILILVIFAVAFLVLFVILRQLINFVKRKENVVQSKKVN